MQPDQSGGIDVREYVSMLRRHIWLIVICTVALGLAAFLYSNSKTPMYEASAQLLYEQPLDINDPLGGGNLDANTQSLQLRAEVFNVTNRLNYENPAATLPNGAPGSGFSDATAGTFGYMLGPLNRTVGLGTAR